MTPEVVAKAGTVVARAKPLAGIGATQRTIIREEEESNRQVEDMRRRDEEAMR